MKRLRNQLDGFINAYKNFPMSNQLITCSYGSWSPNEKFTLILHRKYF